MHNLKVVSWEKESLDRRHNNNNNSKKRKEEMKGGRMEGIMKNILENIFIQYYKKDNIKELEHYFKHE